MKHYGAFEAKTHFSELLTSVMNGEKLVITKHGVEVAMLVPFPKEQKKDTSIADAICTIRKLRKGITLGKDLSIKEMRSEGRR